MFHYTIIVVKQLEKIIIFYHHLLSLSFAGKKNPCGKVDNYRTVTAKFVVSRCVFCKLRGVFWFFCSVNHFSEGGVNTNHYVMCLPSLAENVSRLLKNSKGNGDGEWIFW